MKQPERARFAFALYQRLGPRRSLELLREILAQNGVDISIATLKRWSTRYQWQFQLGDIEDRAELIAHASAVRDRADQLDRQAKLGRALQGAGATALQSLMADRRRSERLGGRDIVALIDTGSRLESGATAEARNRRELAVSLVNVVLPAIVNLYDELNDLPDAEERRQRFAVGLDDILATFISEQE